MGHSSRSWQALFYQDCEPGPNPGSEASEESDAGSKERRDVSIIIGPGVVYAEPTA